MDMESMLNPTRTTKHTGVIISMVKNMDKELSSTLMALSMKEVGEMACSMVMLTIIIKTGPMELDCGNMESEKLKAPYKSDLN